MYKYIYIVNIPSQWVKSGRAVHDKYIVYCRINGSKELTACLLSPARADSLEL